MNRNSSSSKKRILQQARRVLQIELESIKGLIPQLDSEFCKAVDLILSSKGRIIVTAIGKSGHIGRKLTATLVSTGTAAVFLHPSEALHGDLGIIHKKDIVMVLSNSGESEEITNLIPLIKKIGSKIIAMTGRTKSSLARSSDVVLSSAVKKEADPMNLAPTASTTAALALGDALAVVLLNERKFGAKDFAKFHPGGNIGRALLEVKDIMHAGDENPVIQEIQTLKEALFCITSKGLGVVSAVNKNNRLRGIVTDGDIRRIFMKAEGSLDKVFSTPIHKIMSRNPITAFPDVLCMDAVKLMEDNRKHRLITVLPVVDEKNRPVGMIHIHDLIRRGFTFSKGNSFEEDLK